MRVLIDTCISLDFIQRRDPFFEDAKKVFMAMVTENLEGCITVKSLTDIYYVTKHILHDEVSVRTIMENLLAIVKPEDSLAYDAICALSSDMNDFEDALMAISAKTLKVDYIVTRNIKDYKYSPVKPILPKDLLNRL
ncbi:MAG: PIN domain-containing protein [Erysipelotrichaceae bacterium]|nr:PIN domain-containing protein [Erysipelotrichaceae bacterium]